MDIGVRLGPRGWPFAELVASWRAAEEAAFGFVSCSDQITASEGGPTWDAPSLLTVMASCTSDIPLAVHVLNTSMRNPVYVAAQVVAAQALSGGRVSLGLGTGSSRGQLEHQTTGTPELAFRERVARLDAFCRVLPALWRGHAVSHSHLGLRDARLGPTGVEPPRLVIGGSSDAVLGVAARHADIWNGMGDEPDAFTARARRLEQIGHDVAPDRQLVVEALIHVDRYVTDRAWTDLRGHLDQLEAAGADRVVLALDQERGPDPVHRLAEAVGQGSGSVNGDLIEQPR